MENTLKTTLFIPVLNELEGQKIIMPRIKKEWFDEIIVVDGGSNDGQQNIMNRMDIGLFHKNPMDWPPPIGNVWKLLKVI